MLESKLQEIRKTLGVFDLTPVQDNEDILLKRDDLFAPFGVGSVNGGKLRQGIHMLSLASVECYYSVKTGCSVNSPQAPMTAAVSKYFGMDCTIYYGCKEESLEKYSMPRLAKSFGANFRLCKSGRSNVLYATIRKEAHKKCFIVEYGMNSQEPKHFASFYETTAQQVKNLPDKLDKLVITCGSGITSAGILYGLAKYKKQVGQVYLMGNGPNRIHKIKSRLLDLEITTGVFCRNAPFTYVDLCNDFGFKYEERLHCQFGDVVLHPNYEAKAGSWIKMNWRTKDFCTGTNCLWIVGAEPCV